MTTQDLIDSIRQSLTEIEQVTDPSLEPRGKLWKVLTELDSMAAELVEWLEREAEALKSC